MRSSFQKDSDIKKKYVFFSDPDVIVQRAETSAATDRVKGDPEVQQRQGYIAKQLTTGQTSSLPIQFNLKDLENLFSYHPIQPYPFTFISAVKRKLALGDCPDTRKKVYEPCCTEKIEQPLTILQSNTAQNLYQVVQKMDFIRPLKVPDLKISPKTLDFVARENSVSRELMPTKYEAPSKDLIHEKVDKSVKSSERVQRKLDFSTSEGSIVNSEIEPLKVPNISIASNLTKKKDYVRENSREKENRSKRIKKDDSLFIRQDEVAQEILKRSKSPRHVSRKEMADNASETVCTMKFKNDRLSFHMPRESDFGLTKPKSKNFATSTAKKENDKKHRSFNIRLKSARDNSLESKSRTCSNESLSERSIKLPDKVATRESSRHMFESTECRYKDDFHLLKQTDDLRHIFPSDSRQMKLYKVASQCQGKAGNVTSKDQTKKMFEKIRSIGNKVEGKTYIPNSKESEDIEIVTDSNSSLRVHSPCTLSTQQMKAKDSEKVAQNINVVKCNKNVEDSKFTDDSLPQCTSTSTKNDDESFTQTTATTKQTCTNNKSNDFNESSLSQALLDPRRISFRDENRLQQDQFCDLVTPDMNLIFRPKRKKQLTQSNNAEGDAKSTKQASAKVEMQQEGIPMFHPTALHMQFQAELHLLDSFNESLRQVMDVEKCLYNVKEQEKKVAMQSNDELKLHFSKTSDEKNADDTHMRSESSKLYKHNVADKGTEKDFRHTGHYASSEIKSDEFDDKLRMINKPIVKAVEVQTQTVNDIATQTDLRSTRRNVQSRCPDISGITYERGFVEDEIPQLSLDSAEQFEDLDQIEEISLPSKLRTMSEISLHETTSSIRTETGTEISISTRDVTCSFNKYLDLEIAQLIKDEKQRYDKIEMLFKSREKTLNDRTKKLVKLEEQKRALRDTGQDSRISSVKKKQRALLLKLQQEKDEMNRLKELHKIASQERKLMLQKQRNMFNPQMSTKNILTKLKRSADSQSPRRLSGPMKGYDIRSNSSMSSLVDSDKSQHDRSQTDTRLQISESDLHFQKLDLPKSEKFASFIEESNASFSRLDKSNEIIQGDTLEEKCPYKLQNEGTKSKYEIKSRKFEEKMPKTDILKLKSHQHSVESKLIPTHSMSMSGQYLFEKEKSLDDSQVLEQNFSKSISEHAKSESDTLVEELSKKSKPSLTDSHFQSIASPRERESLSKSTAMNTETIQEEISSVNQDTVSKTSRSSQVSEDILHTYSKSSKKSNKLISTDKDISKKTQCTSESKSNSKRKSSKCQKSKSSSSILTENILRSKSNSQISEEFIKHHNKRTKVEKEFIHLDQNDENAGFDNMDLSESQSSLQTLVKQSKASRDKSSKVFNDIINDCESKENISCQKLFNRDLGMYENASYNQEKSLQGVDNVSTKSQVNTFAVSRHSSGESDRNYSKSVVVRSQDHDLKTSKKLEQILSAREAALTSRKNCVEEWMAWHAKLRAEEDRVTRMEQAALKLVTATSNVFSQQERSMCHFIDTTVSSDTSDIEGRIELLTEKLAERRIEMSRLKREARKQTKQKLRALEANLLNQIKRYDTTIHEMRKKLESKKVITKDYEKLAIESKSLADFKVPEIPLKRIQDLYKNNDLLRSRSESDLLSTKKQTKDVMKNISLSRMENVDEKSDKSGLQKQVKGTKSINTSEQISSVRMDTTNHSIQSIFDECISEQIECDKFGSASISSVSDDVRSDRNILYGSKEYINETRSKETIMSDIEKVSISEDIKTEIDSAAKSDENIPTVSGTKFSTSDSSVHSVSINRKANSNAPSKQSHSKNTSLKSETEEVENTEQSQIHSDKPQNYDEGPSVKTKTVETNNEILDFSKKLDFLRLNNKNLNEDISSLENELKALSGILSRFSRKSNEELINEEKSTSKDISEMFLKSDKSDKFDAVADINDDKHKNVEFDKKEINSDTSHYSKNNVKLSSSDRNGSKHLTEEVDVISVIMTQDEVSLTKSNQEIDYKARSKEILNEIEKSIISEHIKTTESDLNRTLLESNNLSSHKKSDEVPRDTVSLQADVSTISEIYSTAVQDSENLSSVEHKSKVKYVGENDTNIQQSSVGTHSSRNQLIEDQKYMARSKSSDLLEKDQSTNLSTYIDYSLTGSNVPSAKSFSENRANSISKDTLHTLPTPSLKHTVEILREQSSQELLSTYEPTVSSKHSTSRARSLQVENKHRDIEDIVNEVSTVGKIDLTPRKGKEELDIIEKQEFKTLNREKDVSVENIYSSQKATDILKSNVDTDDRIGSATNSAREVRKDRNELELISMDKTSFDREDWTLSDSFDVQQKSPDGEWEESERNSKSCSDSSAFTDTRDESQAIDDVKVQDIDENVTSDIEDASLFIPKGESTNIEACEVKLNETISEAHVDKSNDEFEDILSIIGRDSNEQEKQKGREQSSDSEDFQKAIRDSVAKILDKVEKSIESNSVKDKIDSYLDVAGNKVKDTVSSEENKSVLTDPSLKYNLQGKNKIQEVEDKGSISLDVNVNRNFNEETENKENYDEPVIDISVSVEIKDNEGIYHVETKSHEIIITELEPGNIEDELLPRIEIDAKVELAEEESAKVSVSSESPEDQEEYSKSEDKGDVEVIQEQTSLEPVTEQDSSDGEQLDNLVEIAISGLDTIEKRIQSPTHSSDSISAPDDRINVQVTEGGLKSEIETQESPCTSVSVDNLDEIEQSNIKTADVPVSSANKTFDVLKDPEYEDISEESLEVSEILDKGGLQKSVSSFKSSMPEKYEAVQKSEEVLRILDEIAHKSSNGSDNSAEKFQTNFHTKQPIEDNTKFKKISGKDSISSTESDRLNNLAEDVHKEESLNRSSEVQTSAIITLEGKQSIQASTDVTEMKKSHGKHESQQKVSTRYEQDASSDSSEERDTPKGVPDIELDSPRDLNDSKLDIDGLNDDLLSGSSTGNQNVDSKSNFHSTSIVGTSEKDIEVMIDKLKASLEQPGLEVAELEAKLLRIEQLQIELEIKKLEAEEVTYYVREIPNKPPPPYTPPGGGGRVSTSLASPSPPPAVIPSNTEELTAFTEKATALIFKAKEAGEDIMSLEPLPEIYELTKENDETVKKDRRIYNTFLFNLCKETIAEIYQAEYEKPGPSWTKPNVKTKPTMKIPKTVEELNEYVSKEVATLFGFKTKLQRENMVMRWSRKRRDRVDELLAREAQAEEDEWTKFHHDELAVKNGLTVAIVDTLIMETVNVVKVAYAKKRKIMV